MSAAALDLRMTELLCRRSGFEADPALQAVLLALMAACGEGSLCLSLEPSALRESLRNFFASLETPLENTLDSAGLAEAFLEKHRTQVYAGLIGSPKAPKPLILFQNRLYLHRYFYAEKSLAEGMLRLRASGKPSLDPALARAVLREVLIDHPLRHSGPTGAALQFTERQQWALAAAMLEKVFLLSGGPGTGKTALTATLLRALTRVRRLPPGRIRLCAPTGRAAQRLRESLAAHLNSLEKSDVDRNLNFPVETLHRLLGYHPPSGRFARHAGDPLQADLVILDEASMADVFTLAALVKAMPDGSSLILVGDADQLPSVAAGSVLHELLPANRQSSLDSETRQWIRACFPDAPEIPASASSQGLPAVVLDRSHRSRQDILDFAAQVNAGRVEAALETANGSGDVQRVLNTDLPKLLREYAENLFSRERIRSKTYSEWLADIAPSGNPEHPEREEAVSALLEFLSLSRILAFTRHGALGCERINTLLRQHLQPLWDSPSVFSHSGVFHGAPVLITQNDARSGLANGETGIWLRHQGDLVAHFPDSGGIRSIRSFPAAFLPAHEPAFAVTVHKSQGSEYDVALVVLPEAGNRMLAREILYTAVTRARKSVRLFGSENALRESVQKRVRREGGLRGYFPA